MKRNILLAFLCVLVIPQFLFYVMVLKDQNNETVKTADAAETAETADPDIQRMIRVKDGGEFLDMTLKDYVTSVVLGEMPADFEIEALKAQAVAARTFTLRNVNRASKHSDADVCTDSACCQAFTLPAAYSGSAESLEKISSAVKETAGQVITYQGNLIEAVYFSASGGQTEDAVAVWGTDVPYLQSVDSPGEEIAVNLEAITVFSNSDFLKMLGLPDSLMLDEETVSMTYTDGGGVETMTIANVSYSGVQARTLLNLRSTVFSIEFVDDGVQVTTKGYGHRVGMSQYGAEAMALAGSDYQEILAHYYSGTELHQLTQEEMDAIFDKTENI